MAEEIPAPSPGSADGDVEKQVADPGAQVPGQGQSGEPGAVDPGSSQAPSNKDQGRSNFNWANQRLIEKAVSKVLSTTLDERLKPILERLTQQPPGQEAQSEIDYNDLPGSIGKLVDSILKQREGSYINKTFPQLKSELLNDISYQSSLQEARKYLQSQKDIGMDKSKWDEIQEIIASDDVLLMAMDAYPAKVTQKAVEIWRTIKRNPNAPSKDELSTAAGGMGARKPGIDFRRISELKEKVSGVLTPDEQEKVKAEVAKLVSSMA